MNIVKTRISTHYMNTFKLFIEANFGTKVSVGYYTEPAKQYYGVSAFLQFMYDDSISIDVDFIRMKIAFNGFGSVEEAFISFQKQFYGSYN